MDDHLSLQIDAKFAFQKKDRYQSWGKVKFWGSQYVFRQVLVIFNKSSGSYYKTDWLGPQERWPPAGPLTRGREPQQWKGIRMLVYLG